MADNKMKKWFFALILLCFVAIGLWFIGQSDLFEKQDHDRMIVNGVNARTVVVNIHSQDDGVWAELPFVATLGTLGYSPKWINQDTASFDISGSTFYLSLTEKTFYREDEGPSINLLLPPPGSNRFICDRVKNELVVDHRTLWSALYLSGIDVKIQIDAQDKIVYINS